MRNFTYISLFAAALVAVQPAHAAVVIGGFTLDAGGFGTGQGVHSSGSQAGTTLNAFVNQDGSAVTFSSSDDLSITGSGQATIEGEPLISNLDVLFAKGWDSITFNFDNAPGASGTFALLVNGSSLFEGGLGNNCSLCAISGGQNRFTLSGSGITELAFTFDPAISAARQFRVEGVSTGAVPEPATWAMMVGGLGLVGGLMRRRVGKVQFA